MKASDTLQRAAQRNRAQQVNPRKGQPGQAGQIARRGEDKRETKAPGRSRKPKA